MGAFDCSDYAIGKYKNAKEAYKELVERAEYRHGHDGYNGTISTSNGFKMVTNYPRFGTKAWEKFEDDTINGTKWDRWNCIEIKGATAKRWKEQEGFKGRKGIKVYYFWGLAAS